MKQKLFLTLALLMTVCSFGMAQSKQAYAVYTEGDGTISNPNTLTFYYDDQKSSRSGTKYDLNTGNSDPGWYTDHKSDIQRVDFDESFKSARPTSTYRWFSCSNLTELVRLSHLNTSAVTNMSYMFYGCKLSSIDLTYFDTSKVTTMESMFDSCSQLITVNVLSFNTSNVTSMKRMFNWCTELTYINLASFDTKKIENQGFVDMFYSCSKLKTIYAGSGWVVNTELGGRMFAGCSQLVGGEGTRYEELKYGSNFAHVDGGTSNPGYFTQIPSGYAVLEGNSLTFYNDGKMDEKDGPVYPLNIGSENPTWPRNRAVDRVVFDESFATARPVSTFFWFKGCTILTEFVGMQYLNTSEVTDMEGMFMDCTSISNLDLSHFNTSKVTSMASMFSSCENLQKLNLSNFDTSNVTSMSMMFNGCKGLETLDLSSFNTSNVAYMIFMFNWCSELKTLNLGSFNTGNAADQMYMMFQNCGNLTTIYVGRKWTVSNSGCYAMFSGCNSLVGGQGTKLIETEYVAGENTFAHIDGGPSNPGYLTAAPSLGIATSLNQVTSDKSQVTSDEWYTIDGKKLNGMPAKKGIYIHNGKKAVLKN